MHSIADFFEINKNSWNQKVESHLKSKFYDVDGFKKGKSSLNTIELDLLGDIKGKTILHLQCHFGQDSLSLARMGATVTAVDFSENAIISANNLANELNIEATFICCNIYDLPDYLNKQFDIVFTSYGTIGWLPDIKKWAKIVSLFLKPEGQFIMAEFHPFVWMYNSSFSEITYRYFNSGEIVETESGTYADKSAELVLKTVGWNHGISEVLNALISNDIQIEIFNEYDYSPYNCFQNMVEITPNHFQIEAFGNKLPLVYAIKGLKSSVLFIF